MIKITYNLFTFFLFNRNISINAILINKYTWIFPQPPGHFDVVLIFELHESRDSQRAHNGQFITHSAE